MDLKISTRRINGGAIIDLQGEVDVYTAPELKQEIINLMEHGAARVTINLHDVQYLDSTALGVLIGGLKRLKERNGMLDLMCPNARIRRVLEVTGLDQVFNIYSSEQEAMNSPAGDS